MTNQTEQTGTKSSRLRTRLPTGHVDPSSLDLHLGEFIDTDTLSRAAAFAHRGREDLAQRGFAADGKKRLRTFSIWEVCRFLIPTEVSVLREALLKHPEWPQGVGEANAKRFTLDEVFQLREYMQDKIEGLDTLAWKPEKTPPKVVAVANFKGGVGKTSTCAHLAMSAALDGYRVLVIDLDSQGSLTSIFGGRVDDEWTTVFPLIASDYANYLRHENTVRQAQGQSPFPIDEILERALEVSPRNLIQPTHWPNIDLIGAQLNLYWAEFQVPVWRMQARSWPLWDGLTNALSSEEISGSYDIVFLDTPPALGYLTINALAAADILLIPLGASFLEFDSTGRFLDMIHTTFASIEDGENAARKRAGKDPIKFEWDAVKALITRYDASQQADLAEVIQAYFGDLMISYKQESTAMVGQAGEQVNGIYEADYRDFNRDTYLRGRATFDQTWIEVKKLVVASWLRDLAEGESVEEFGS